jgi:hypothetical protein
MLAYLQKPPNPGGSKDQQSTAFPVLGNKCRSLLSLFVNMYEDSKNILYGSHLPELLKQKMREGFTTFRT